MVAGAAAPVEHLAVVAAERVDLGRVHQRLQVPVDGGQADLVAAPGQDVVDLLSTGEPVEVVQDRADSPALTGVACGLDHGSSYVDSGVIRAGRRRTRAPTRAATPKPARASMTIVGPGCASIS